MNMQTYVNEVMRDRLRMLMSGFISCSFAVCGIFINLVSIKFNHYKFYFYLLLVFNLASCVIYFFFVESPFYLYKKKKIQSLYLVLRQICEANFSDEKRLSAVIRLEQSLRFGKHFRNKAQRNTAHLQKILITDTDFISENKESLDEFNFCFDNQQILENEDSLLLSKKKSSEQSNSISEQSALDFLEFFSAKNLWVSARLVVVFAQAEVIFTLSLIVNKDLGISNFFVSGSLISLIQAVGYFVGSFVNSHFGRRSINIVIAGMVTGLSLLVLIVDLVSRRYSESLLRGAAVGVLETGETHKDSDSVSFFA